MSRLAGRFHLIEKVDDKVVVGLLGNLFAKNLTLEDKCFIAGFYNVKRDGCTFETVKTYVTTDGKAVGSYNDFLIIRKGNQ